MAILYTTLQAVADRLIGKVRFTTDEEDENRMSERLAKRLIAEAEGQVEHHLSPRYAMPFQTVDGQAFDRLPERPTKELIKTMAEIQACLRILETDFGSGGAVDGEKYTKALAARYEKMRNSILARKKDGGRDSQGWKYPPLPGLMLNYMNTEADDGYMGAVIVASGSASQGYAREQINNPAENFWNGEPPGGCDED